MLYLFRTRLNEAYIANVFFANLQGHLSVFQLFFSFKISSDFAFLISQETISHIFGSREVRFLFQSTLCSFFAFIKLNHFQIVWFLYKVKNIVHNFTF